MKKIITALTFLTGIFAIAELSVAQDADSSAVVQESSKDKRPVKDAFESNWLITSQTAIVPTPNTLELDINHHFGPFKNGIKDMYGLYAASNIRLGLSYTPVKNLQIGAGMTKEQMMYDFNIKWNPLQQTRSGSFPLFITYVGNVVAEGNENTVNWTLPDMSGKDSIVSKRYPKSTDRISYFNQLIIGRKITDRISMQIAGSFSHYNLIDTMANKNLAHDNIAVSAAGRVKVYGDLSVIMEYTYPLSPAEKVKPNLAFGIEATTSAHAFQLFISPYSSIISQRNMMFNKMDPNFISDYGIGFNVTRLWNF